LYINEPITTLNSPADWKITASQLMPLSYQIVLKFQYEESRFFPAKFTAARFCVFLLRRNVPSFALKKREVLRFTRCNMIIKFQPVCTPLF
jgi:hypothetical protein